MRISDWSSDVCSSDLARLARRGAAAATHRALWPLTIKTRPGVEMVLPSLYLHRKKRGRRGHYMFNGLVAYLDSIKARDPAPRSRWEILLYPGLLAVGMHRVVHWLFDARLFFLAGSEERRGGKEGVRPC